MGIQGLGIMRLLILLIGKQLDGILLTGNTLCRLLFSSGLTNGQKALGKSFGRCIATLGTAGARILIQF